MNEVKTGSARGRFADEDAATRGENRKRAKARNGIQEQKLTGFLGWLPLTTQSNAKHINIPAGVLLLTWLSTCQHAFKQEVNGLKRCLKVI